MNAFPDGSGLPAPGKILAAGKVWCSMSELRGDSERDKARTVSGTTGITASAVRRSLARARDGKSLDPDEATVLLHDGSRLGGRVGRLRECRHACLHMGVAGQR